MDDRDLRVQQRRARRRKNELIMKCLISLLILVVVFLLVILTKEAIVPGVTGLIETRRQEKQAVSQGSGSDGAENAGALQQGA